MAIEECPCGSGEFPDEQVDGHGIFMCFTCSKCFARKIKGFRPDIFEAYACEEPIEEDY